MATSLRPLQLEMSSSDWTTTKTPVISNHVLVIFHRNAFICIYSYFSPKIGCHGNAPLSLVYASVTDEFPIGLPLTSSLLLEYSSEYLNEYSSTR